MLKEASSHPLLFPNQDSASMAQVHIITLPLHSQLNTPRTHPWVEQETRPLTWKSSERGWWMVRITMRSLRASSARRMTIWFAVMQSRPVVGSSNIMTSAGKEGQTSEPLHRPGSGLKTQNLTSPLPRCWTPSKQCPLRSGCVQGERPEGEGPIPDSGAYLGTREQQHQASYLVPWSLRAPSRGLWQGTRAGR